MPAAQSLTSGEENYPERRGDHLAGHKGGRVMSSQLRPRWPITQTAKNVISEKQVLSHVLMIRHRVIRSHTPRSL